MNDLLLIKKGSNLMNRLTAISGNVDFDKLTPSIWIAQVTDIKRILTKDLYEKILNDFDNDSLTGDYQIIFEEFISSTLVFYATSHFISENAIMIANGGNFKHLPDNAQVADYKETDRQSKRYRELGAHFELEFYEFMKDKNIPEYKRGCRVDTDSFKFGWEI